MVAVQKQSYGNRATETGLRKTYPISSDVARRERCVTRPSFSDQPIPSQLRIPSRSNIQIAETDSRVLIFE